MRGWCMSETSDEVEAQIRERLKQAAEQGDFLEWLFALMEAQDLYVRRHTH